MSDEDNEYHVVDLNGKVTRVHTSRTRELCDCRCKRCGSKMIVYDGDPHNHIACPICKWYESSGVDYSDKDQMVEIAATISELSEQLNWHINLMRTVMGVNKVREMNLNDEAMKRRHINP